MEEIGAVTKNSDQEFEKFLEKFCEENNEKNEMSQLKTDLGDLKKITEQYLRLMAACIQYDYLRAYFEKNPREVLFYFVPRMIIPKDAIIKLEANAGNWPVIYFREKNSNKEYKYKEYSDSVMMSTVDEGENQVVQINEFRYLNKATKMEHIAKGGAKTRKIDEVKVNKDCNIQIEVPLDADKCEKIIVLPYFTFETDLITSFKFQGEEDNTIVLSCCS